MAVKGKVKAKLAQSIVSILAEEKGLTVAEGAEILKSCHALVSEGTLKVIAEAESRPLSEALSHLNRSDIKIVSSLQ
ncbi:hypothetical protein KAR91_58140 [Candidatus Pacearchaeota archaeon]|nr:hypothetical protein [Candidatus Pacearchaeota archaeon]